MQIGTHGGDQIDIDGQKPAVLVHCHAGIGNIVPAMGVGDEVFRAVRGPLDRPAKAFCRFHGEGVFAIGKHLGAEASTDIGRDDADTVWILARDPRQMAADVVHTLGTDGNGVAVFLAPLRKAGANFHVVADQPVVDDSQLADTCCLRKGFRRFFLVTEEGSESEVGTCLGVDKRRILRQRAFGIDDHIEVLEFHFDQFARIARLRHTVSNDKGNGIADMPHDAVTQYRKIAVDDRRPVAILDRGDVFQRLEMRRVCSGQNQMNAVCLKGCRNIGGPEAGMGIRRAQHIAVQHPLCLDVVCVAAVARCEGIILLAQDGCTHSEFRMNEFVHQMPPADRS